MQTANQKTQWQTEADAIMIDKPQGRCRQSTTKEIEPHFAPVDI